MLHLTVFQAVCPSTHVHQESPGIEVNVLGFLPDLLKLKGHCFTCITLLDYFDSIFHIRITESFSKYLCLRGRATMWIFKSCLVTHLHTSGKYPLLSVSNCIQGIRMQEKGNTENFSSFSLLHIQVDGPLSSLLIF